MEEPIVNESTIVEGIGDEIVYSVGAGLSVLILTVYMFSRFHRQAGSRGIHADSQAYVDQTREELRSHNIGPTTERVSRNRSQDQTCPICLTEARYGIETNCGHLFCGQCIITYWTHGTWLGAVRCPVCRQQVTMLLFNFTPEETQATGTDKDHVISKIHSYNRRFSGQPRPFLDYIWDMPTLLRHAVTEFFSMGGLIWMFRLRVFICFIAAILYLISPLDIIPEAVFGLLGLLDDVFIILLLAIYVSMIYRQMMEDRARGAAS